MQQRDRFFCALARGLCAGLLTLAAAAPALAQRADADLVERSRAWLAAQAVGMEGSSRGDETHRAAPASAEQPTLGERVAEAIESGMASWYGPGFHRKRTASGERFDMHALTAAHPTLPFGTQVCVRGLQTGRTVLVRINDRGPHVGGRIIDLSRAAAQALGLLHLGTKTVALVEPLMGNRCP